MSPLSFLELEWARNFRASGFIGLRVSGLGQSLVSQICLLANQAFEVVVKLKVIFVTEPNGLPTKALMQTGLGLYRASGLCTAGPEFSPGLRAQA